MKPELADKLVEVIAAIQSKVATATDFAVSQLPDVAQQYLTYGRVSTTIAFVVFFLLLCLGIAFVVRGWMEEEEGFFIVGGVITTISAISTVFILNHLILVWFAPKIYILKGLAGLLK